EKFKPGNPLIGCRAVLAVPWHHDEPDLLDLAAGKQGVSEEIVRQAPTVEGDVQEGRGFGHVIGLALDDQGVVLQADQSADGCTVVHVTANHPWSGFCGGQSYRQGGHDVDVDMGYRAT